MIGKTVNIRFLPNKEHEIGGVVLMIDRIWLADTMQEVLPFCGHVAGDEFALYQKKFGMIEKNYSEFPKGFIYCT